MMPSRIVRDLAQRAAAGLRAQLDHACRLGEVHRDEGIDYRGADRQRCSASTT
jgi:hypothetical protein